MAAARRGKTCSCLLSIGRHVLLDLFVGTYRKLIGTCLESKPGDWSTAARCWCKCCLFWSWETALAFRDYQSLFYITGQLQSTITVQMIRFCFIISNDNVMEQKQQVQASWNVYHLWRKINCFLSGSFDIIINERFHKITSKHSNSTWTM